MGFAARGQSAAWVWGSKADSRSTIVHHVDESQSLGTADPVLCIPSRLVGLFKLVVIILDTDWNTSIGFGIKALPAADRAVEIFQAPTWPFDLDFEPLELYPCQTYGRSAKSEGRLLPDQCRSNEVADKIIKM